MIDPIGEQPLSFSGNHMRKIMILLIMNLTEAYWHVILINFRLTLLYLIINCPDSVIDEW